MRIALVSCARECFCPRENSPRPTARSNTSYLSLANVRVALGDIHHGQRTSEVRGNIWMGSHVGDGSAKKTELACGTLNDLFWYPKRKARPKKQHCTSNFQSPTKNSVHFSCQLQTTLTIQFLSIIEFSRLQHFPDFEVDIPTNILAPIILVQ